jgi:hypothetical protein
MTSNINLEANKASKLNISFYKYYNKKKYIEPKYFIKYPELKKTSNNKSNKDKKNESDKAIISAFTIINKEANYKLILDSGILEYYIPLKE